MGVSRSRVFCPVCLATAIERGDIMRGTKILSHMSTISDTVALVYSENPTKGQPEDISHCNLRPQDIYQVPRIPIWWNEYNKNRLWESLVHLALRSKTTKSLQVLIDSNLFDFSGPLQIQLPEKVSIDEPELWFCFERSHYSYNKCILCHRRQSWYTISNKAPSTNSNRSYDFRLAVLTPVQYCIQFGRLRHLRLLVECGKIDVNRPLKTSTSINRVSAIRALSWLNYMEHMNRWITSIFRMPYPFSSLSLTGKRGTIWPWSDCLRSSSIWVLISTCAELFIFSTLCHTSLRYFCNTVWRLTLRWPLSVGRIWTRIWIIHIEVIKTVKIY